MAEQEPVTAADDERRVRIFVSYRRDDAPDATDRLAHSLIERLGRDNVFIDVDSIEIGGDFAQVIGDWVGRCDALLAVIGRGWADARDDGGNRRRTPPTIMCDSRSRPRCGGTCGSCPC